MARVSLLAGSGSQAVSLMDVSVKITGLRELGRAFRQMDVDLPKELKAEFLPVAQRVVGVVQQRMPHRSGRAQGSVKARASARGASIAAGGRAAPYYQWLDFGGSVGRNRSVKRTMPKGGRYIYPAIAESRDEIVKGADEAVAKVARSAGFGTRGGL